MRELILEQNDFLGLAGEVLHQGGSFSFKAHGSSMYPFIRNGDVLRVEPVAGDALGVGTIALYRCSQNRFGAHRVVRRHVRNGRTLLTMRGDALLRPDETVAAIQVVGKVVGVQRGQKVVRLDRGPWLVASGLWQTSHPLGPFLLKMASWTRRIVSRLFTSP